MPLTAVPAYRRFAALFSRPQADGRSSDYAALLEASVAASPMLDNDRRALFMQLCCVAHRHGLHVAPEVSLDTIFTVKGGEAMDRAQKALHGKRVDFVLLNGSAWPVLAIDHVGENPRGDRAKLRAFERARITLLEVCGGAALEDDMDYIDLVLTDILDESAVQAA